MLGVSYRLGCQAQLLLDAIGREASRFLTKIGIDQIANPLAKSIAKLGCKFALGLNSVCRRTEVGQTLCCLVNRCVNCV